MSLPETAVPHARLKQQTSLSQMAISMRQYNSLSWRRCVFCAIISTRSHPSHPLVLEITLVLPGPEQPLVDGVETHFRKGQSNA